MSLQTESIFEPADETVTLRFTRGELKMLVDAIGAKLMTVPIEDINGEHPLVRAAANISSTCKYGTPF